MSDDALQGAGHSSSRQADIWPVDSDSGKTDLAIAAGAVAAANGKRSQPMNLRYAARAAYRVFTAPKVGPSLYDVCDSLLLRSNSRRRPSATIL